MSIRKTWDAMSHKDRMRWLIVGTAISVGLYGLLVYPFVSRDLTKSSALVARRLDRIEKRAQVPKVDAASTAVLQGKLSKLSKERESLEGRYRELGSHFAPSDQPEARQTLLLELNTLAQSSGIQMLEQGDERDKNGARLLEDKESGRPYMRVLGTGDYWSLLAFVKGLSTLTYSSAPLGMELRSNMGTKDPKETKDSREPTVPQVSLDIHIDVTL